MVTESELARRIKAAMDWREIRIPSAYVARKCGVTPQAVNKWRKDGQVDLRKHISDLSSATQVPPMFYIEPEPGQSKETRSAWERLMAFAKDSVVAVFAALPFIEALRNCVLCQISPQPSRAS